ncbi:MAG: ABC transporter ATP-binding protein, partial [Actinobacteria bacterium]|nr:ABC transporter ATP-binding protein [Actinomycetota bacterium]
MPEPAPHALELRDLDVVYRVRGRDRLVLRGVTLTVKRGEAYGLVGESGCGKSTAALAIVQYLPRNGRVRSGAIEIDGRDVLSLSGGELRRLRSESVSMVYQNPGAALNPSIGIGKQVAEVFRIRGIGRDESLDRARAALARVQIADPGSVMARYPHQLSGGMQQRVIIAMALATDPALLILDEPTTGLDATVEAEVLDLVAALQAELRTSVLFISHNLGVIAKMCDRVGVLYAGRLVEEGLTETVLRDPRHPYTVGLLRCIPRGGTRKDHGRLDTIPGFLPNLGEELPGCVFAPRCALVEEICRLEEPPLYDVGGTHVSRCHFHERAQTLPRALAANLDLPVVDRAEAPLLAFDDLGKVFKQQGHDVHALVGASTAIWPGETLGLVGESGSGKTTLARTLLGIVEPTSGGVTLDGKPLSPGLGGRSRAELRALQIVFQNPDSALNRRHQVGRILKRSLKKLAGLTGRPAEERLLELMQSVRLAERYVSARPGQLSGGLKQRVAIARAFAGDPSLVVC